MHSWDSIEENLQIRNNFQILCKFGVTSIDERLPIVYNNYWRQSGVMHKLSTKIKPKINKFLGVIDAAKAISMRIC